MARFDKGPVAISYDDEGNPEGDPVLLVAPGGMRSANEKWNDAPWNPRTALAHDYRLIGMDQRNAGHSFGPVSASSGWAMHRDDQLALLDHLEVERCHVVGMCIGGPYIFGLLAAAPQRFASAVVLQPVGIDGNRAAFYEIFDDWRGEAVKSHPQVSDQDWQRYRSNMWDGDFVLTATADELAILPTPMLVALGNDLYHPESISRAVAAAVPGAELIEQWKEPEHLESTDRTIRDFLATATRS